MKTLVVLLVFAAAARAQQAEPAASPAPKAGAEAAATSTAEAGIDPQWKVDPRAAAALKAIADRSQRFEGIMPKPDAGGWEDFHKEGGPEYSVAAPPAGSGIAGSYVYGLVKVEDGPGGKKGVHGDLTNLVLPNSPNSSLTIGDLQHPAAVKDSAGFPVTSSGRPMPKGPSAAVAVTLKLHW
jgi:hypothetical protein